MNSTRKCSRDAHISVEDWCIGGEGQSCSRVKTFSPFCFCFNDCIIECDLRCFFEIFSTLNTILFLFSFHLISVFQNSEKCLKTVYLFKTLYHIDYKLDRYEKLNRNVCSWTLPWNTLQNDRIIFLGIHYISLTELGDNFLYHGFGRVRFAGYPVS